jgi:hypothetical protein
LLQFEAVEPGKRHVEYETAGTVARGREGLLRRANVQTCQPACAIRQLQRFAHRDVVVDDGRCPTSAMVDLKSRAAIDEVTVYDGA